MTANQNTKVSPYTNRSKHWGDGYINGRKGSKSWHPYQAHSFGWEDEDFKRRHAEHDREFKRLKEGI